MKKEIIDGYEVYSENGEFKNIIFNDYLNNKISISIEQQYLKIELLKRRKERYSEEHEKRKHIDAFLKNDSIINIKTLNKIKTPEEIVLENDGKERIIKEIWNLPEPQNRRVYMFIVDEFSLTKIAKIENRCISVIKRSIDSGLEKLRKKLKNF